MCGRGLRSIADLSTWRQSIVRVSSGLVQPAALSPAGVDSFCLSVQKALGQPQPEGARLTLQAPLKALTPPGRASGPSCRGAPSVCTLLRCALRERGNTEPLLLPDACSPGRSFTSFRHSTSTMGSRCLHPESSSSGETCPAVRTQPCSVWPPDLGMEHIQCHLLTEARSILCVFTPS